jgi:hypothetical protein
MGRNKESVSKFGRSHGCVVESLIVEVSVGSWPNEVAAFAHRVPVFFRRSSRSRCFSSQ